MSLDPGKFIFIFHGRQRAAYFLEYFSKMGINAFVCHSLLFTVIDIRASRKTPLVAPDLSACAFAGQTNPDISSQFFEVTHTLIIGWKKNYLIGA